MRNDLGKIVPPEVVTHSECWRCRSLDAA